MPDESARRGAVVTLQVLLAMMFLAIIGGTAGYLLGVRQKAQTSAHPGRGVGATVTQSPSRITSTGQRCLAHTEALAGGRPLYRVLYLKTNKSEVWICQDTSGALYYQGHRLNSGDDLVEGVNALYLPGVAYQNGEWVATNTNPDGEIIIYHVNKYRLIIQYRGGPSPPPDETQPAAGN